MADNAAKYGFRFHSTKSGSGTPSPVKRFAATGYNGQPDGATSVDMNIGDVVTLVNDGSVKLAASTDTIYGVIVGFGPYWDGEKMVPTKKLPNANAWGTNIARRCEIHVIPAKGNVFEVDMDDAVTYTTQATYEAAINTNFDLAVSCDSTTKKANYRLDANTSSTTDGQWRLEAISDTVENQDFSGSYVKVLVSVNESAEAGSPTVATVIDGV